MFVRNPAAIVGMAMLFAILVVADRRAVGLAGRPVRDQGGAADAAVRRRRLARQRLPRPRRADHARSTAAARRCSVGAVAALLSVVIGVTIGAFAGYYGGKVDAALMRVTEFFQVLPALLFAMVIVTLFGPTLVHVTIAIGIVSWTGTARLTRAEFMQVRGLEFVRAERGDRRPPRPHHLEGDPAQRAAAARSSRPRWRSARPSCSRPACRFSASAIRTR